MKRVVYILIALVSLLRASHAQSAPYGGPGLGDLHSSFVQGDVQIKTVDTPEWVPASINMPLREGDRIWVPEGGRVELYRRDGTAVRLDENTSLELLTTGGESMQVYLAAGRAYVGYRGNRNDVLQFDSPVASMRVYGGARFSVEVGTSGETEVSVYTGLVYAESRSGRTEIAAGKSLFLRDDSYADLSPLGPLDEWGSWNRDRDERYDSGYSHRYLPEELRGYSHEFDTSGRWTFVREYGYVWTPTLGISIGWAPYRVGRWVWMGRDYVWISYDPWGWVPHHYGRWVFAVSTGWCWVPPVRASVYWSPGYVGWVYTPQYIAWVPLAPGDVYYGYGHYGPHSVNLINVNINRITVNKVYRNAHLSDGVTVVNRHTFVTGRGDRVVVKENPFLRDRASVGSPRIRPEKSSFMPVVKDIPQAKQPPQAVRDLRHEELKHRRPIVKERGVSVLRPQVPQRTMPMRVYDKPKGAESRSYVEKEPVPQRKVRPSDGTKKEGRRTGEPESVRGPKEPERKPAERRKDTTVAPPQSVPPPPAERLPQPGILREGGREKAKKGPDAQNRDRGGRPAETRGLREAPPTESPPSQPDKGQVKPPPSGQSESPVRGGSADKRRARETERPEGKGAREADPRMKPPAEERQGGPGGVAKPDGEPERRVPGRQYEPRDRGQGMQERQVPPPAYPVPERRY